MDDEEKAKEEKEAKEKALQEEKAKKAEEDKKAKEMKEKSDSDKSDLEKDQIILHNLIFKHINKISRLASKSNDVNLHNHSAKDIQKLINMLKISLTRELQLPSDFIPSVEINDIDHNYDIIT